MNIHKQYQIFLLSLLSIIFMSQSNAQCDHVSDSLALVALYNATNGENWERSGHWLEEGQPIDTWAYVGTNEEGCVKGLYLQDNNLTGSIPPEIGNLNNLERCWFHENQLEGSIPTEIGNLDNLTSLHLNDNQLTGSIPEEIGNLVNLTALSLYNNELTGSIPAGIGNLVGLTKLDLKNNNLTGSIPAEVGNLVNLTEFILYQNEVSGSLPAEMGNLSQLSKISFSGNNISGNLPPEIGNLSNLTVLNLYDNNLTGTIPPEIGNLSNLITLDFYGCDLTGTIPSEIGNLTQLKNLKLSFNEFSGGIPVEITRLTALQNLGLRSCGLSGNIPLEMGNLTNLSFLSMSYNNLTGNIPSEMGNLENLGTLDLSFNQLTGNLPPELSNLSNLYAIILNDNQFYGCFPEEYATFCDIASSIGIIRFGNNFGLPNNGDFDLFCANGPSPCNLTIEGTITFDENLDCAAADTETGLQQWIVKAATDENTFYGITDADGHYNIYTTEGDYNLELLAFGPYWNEDCTNPATVTVGTDLGTEIVDFFPNIRIECPYLTTDVSTPFLRRCFPNTYVVNFCNTGTALAEDAYMTIEFPDLINIDSASIEINDQVDNTLIFELGDLAVNECGTFLVYTNVSCDAELGQGACVFAHIYPDTICSTSPEWSGATVAVQGQCDGDEVVFKIGNIGDGNMTEERSFVVIEDGVIMLQGDPFQLNSEEEFEIRLPANGATYVCRAMQVNHHPVRGMPSIAIEACGVNENGGFSTGYLSQFPEYDNASFLSVDCHEIVSSFDPNDKIGYPVGYGEAYFIEKGQDIEYRIRFQNTGTDTAFTVMIEDEISPNLDMGTFRKGASSHPYSVKIVGDHTLQFLFEDILLVDSFANEPASHGFVKFKISQKEGLELGATIENEAAIFFDFNEAVLTNKTLHTIGERFIEIVATNEPFGPNLKATLAPNPVKNKAIIRLSGIEYKDAQFYLFSPLGVLLRNEKFSGNELVFKKDDLPTGIYLFEIKAGGQTNFSGKMVIQ